MKMRSLGISAISVLMTAAVIGNAYYQKKQFYPSVVYITKSNASMAVIYVQFFVIVLMLGKLLRKIFLGTLRAAEFEHLMERFWYALTETCLAFTVFRDDFNPRFVALFTVLLFLKSFHWLAEERVDYMERSPIIGWLFHVRVASLLTVLGILDYLMIMHAYNQTMTKGPTVQLVFGFEYAILITMIANAIIKYVMHAAEMRADAPWENKAVFLLYTELVIGLIKVILYLLFVVIMAKIYALPMFVFRPMFYTLRNFKKALNDVIMSRRAIRNMNTLYPDATPEELAMSDNICIICREDMVNNSKKLPCGHIFHTACLRSWFQRQQTCPTCRLNILRTAHSTSVSRPEVINSVNNNQNNAAAANQPSLISAAGFNINNNNNIPPFDNRLANLLDQISNHASSTLSNTSSAIPSIAASSLPPPPPPLMFPPPPSFPFIAPYTVPPPPMPPGLDTLTDDEVRALEGTERRHVEERIRLLRNIQLLLDASFTLMNQYSAIAARLPQFAAPSTTVVQSTTTTTESTASVSSPTSTTNNNASTGQNQTAGTSSTSSVPPTSFLMKPELISAKNKDNSSRTCTGTSIINESSSNADLKLKSTISNTNGTTSNNNNNKDNQIHIEDIGSEENLLHPNSDGNNSSSDCSELSELRRRRLQKFLQQEQNNTANN